MREEFVEDESEDGDLELHETALRNVIRSYRLSFSRNSKNLTDRLQDALHQAYEHITIEKESDEPFKVYASLQANFYKPSNANEVSNPAPNFNTEPAIVLTTTNVQDIVELFYTNLLHQVDEYERSGSGWILQSFIYFDLHFMKYKPLRGSSYLKMPEKFTKGFINIENNDQKCFTWAVLAHLHPVAHGVHDNRVSNYTSYETELNMTGIEYPVPLKDINKFELQNPTISISVFGLSNNDLYPLRISKSVKEQHIRLLLITNEKNNHYVLIKNLSAMVSNQINKDHHHKWICDNCLNPFTTESVLKNHLETCMKFDCVKELYPSNDKRFLKFTKYEHQLPCPFIVVADFETLQVPICTVQPNPKLSSTNAYANHRPCSAAYYIVSTDSNFYQQPKVFKGERCVRYFLDALQEDVEKLRKIIKKSIEMDLSEEEREIYDNSTICHICEKVGDPDDLFVPDHCHLTGAFRGAAHTSCNLNYRIIPERYKVPVFFHNLTGYDAHFIMQEVVPSKHGAIRAIPKTGEQYISFTVGNIVFKDSYAFLSASLEELAEKSKQEDMKHTRKFIEENITSTGYESVNASVLVEYNEVHKRKQTSKQTTAKRRKCDFINDEALETENESENDSDNDDNDIDNLINDNVDENSISFYHKIDNTKKSNLYKLHELPIDDYRNKIYPRKQLNDTENEIANNRFKLVTRKGVFPYEYFDQFSKFDETALPPQNNFFSSISNEHISDEDYEFAQNVFTTFNMKNLWDYHDLYLLTDVMLLADILVTFRNRCLECYKIDPFHSYTAPGFSWQAALRMTDVELELINNPDMYKFFEMGIRGGVSVITHRHAKADSESALLYIDANNLYGHGMVQYLPTGNFVWLQDSLCKVIKVTSIADSSPRGLVLEVDCYVPPNFHDQHNDFPLCPEKMSVDIDMLSSEQLSILTKLQRQQLINTNQNFIGPIRPIVPQTEKLIPNLLPKKNYVVHYRTLKQYIQQGLIVTKVHRALTFNQAPWLKKYIDFNTMQRAKATSEFEKSFFKLLNNSVFGKTIQNVRKERKIDIVDTEKKALKLIAQSSFKNVTRFRSDLIAVERRKTSIMFNKPIYIGFSVLELSKELMYNFHYNNIKKQYPGQLSQLCFTDTDSFLYKIQTKNIYIDMIKNSEHFDFSDYPNSHSCFTGMSLNAIEKLKLKNKKVIGKFKDELKGEEMLEFVGLRAKMYSYKTNSDEVKKCKGIKTSVVKQEIQFDHYKDCLLNQQRMSSTMHLFKVKNHHVQSIVQNKISLSCYDDKRYLLSDNVSSLAYGHYRIK